MRVGVTLEERPFKAALAVYRRGFSPGENAHVS